MHFRNIDAIKEFLKGTSPCDQYGFFLTYICKIIIRANIRTSAWKEHRKMSWCCSYNAAYCKYSSYKYDYSISIFSYFHFHSIHFPPDYDSSMVSRKHLCTYPLCANFFKYTTFFLICIGKNCQMQRDFHISGFPLTH